MMRRLVVFFAVLMCVLALFLMANIPLIEKGAHAIMTDNKSTTLPVIDRDTVQKIETATFGLG